MSKTKVIPITDSLDSVARKTSWYVSANSPKTVDDLNFTSRDEDGVIRWWDVVPPKTDYYHAHQMLGRAYAFELLDLINNPKAKGDNDRVFACIASELVRQGHTGNDGLYNGFFEGISEYLVNGTANR